MQEQQINNSSSFLHTVSCANEQIESAVNIVLPFVVVTEAYLN